MLLQSTCGVSVKDNGGIRHPDLVSTDRDPTPGEVTG